MAVAQIESKIVSGALLNGKYRVEREIGRGGMAVVYEAEHIALGKKVAVKVLAAELSNSAIVIERFFREARAAASVKSPYIVEVYDSGRLEDGRPFIAMEYLEGESLYDRMARVRLIDPVTTVRVLTQCCKGLLKAHALGIVHRDLKPENIHLTKGEEGEEIAKILDFGLAKFYAPVRPDEKTARLTREGAVFGTPAYMSPEQVKGQGSVDHRADLWALGCMAFECLTGRPVWNTDQGVAMTFAAIAAASPPIPSKLRPDLPPAFDIWFKKALERDVARRFQTAMELAEALQKAFNTPQISLINVSDLERVARDLEELPSETVELMESERPPPAHVSPDATLDTALRRGQHPGDHLSQSLSDALQATEPVPLSARREPAPSATDLPGTASPDSFGARGTRPSPSGARIVFSVAMLGIGLSAAYFAWTKLLRPQVSTPIVASSATAPTSSPTGPSSSATAQAPDSNAPPWMATIGEGQRLLWSGDADAALAKFKEAKSQGGGLVAQSFFDNVTIGKATTGPCKLLAFSHPRMGFSGQIGRPTVAVGPKGAVVAWTDDHEQAHTTHAFGVLLDQAGRPTSKPLDMTPEADTVWRPSLFPFEDRIALLYWDKAGASAGVRVRWLDGDGRIGGQSVPVSGARQGDFWPTLDRAPNGTFWVAWEEDRDKEGNDLFLRHLDKELVPLGPEIRATDYVAPEKQTKGPIVDDPSMSISGRTMFLAYTIERDKQHLLQRIRIPLDAPELAGAGLEERAPTQAVPGGGSERRKDREIVQDVTIVNDDKSAAYYPDMACGKDGCFVVWHEMPRGAQAAMFDPVKGIVLWRKRFTSTGSHPALGVSTDGQVQVAFYDAGKVRIAALSRDGVGTTTTFAKVSSEQPRPWVTSGPLKGEWYVAWQDAEAGHTEAFVARLACRD